MNDSSRLQGGLICGASALLGLVFLFGLLGGQWWAVAIPVGILLGFVLALTFWVGWTIATIQVEPEADPGADPAGPEAGNQDARA